MEELATAQPQRTERDHERQLNRVRRQTPGTLQRPITPTAPLQFPTAKAGGSAGVTTPAGQTASASANETQNQSPQAMQRTLQQQRREKAGSATQAAASAASKPLHMLQRMRTAQQLRTAWGSLLGIATFPIGLLYINYHYLRAYHGGPNSKYCKFGQEWMPPALAASNGSSGMLQIGEIILMFILDLFLALLIFLALALIALLAMAVLFPLTFLKSILNLSIWDMVKSLFNFSFS